jgi:hypothetical protein
MPNLAVHYQFSGSVILAFCLLVAGSKFSQIPFGQLAVPLVIVRQKLRLI